MGRVGNTYFPHAKDNSAILNRYIILEVVGGGFVCHRSTLQFGILTCLLAEFSRWVRLSPTA